MKQYNNEKYIVSFTTYPARFNNAAKFIYHLLENQTYKDFHLVCTLYKDDYKQLSGNLKLFVDNDLIEIIIADENLCPHLKYFYAMKKYWDKPIITLDDDWYYDENEIKFLVDKYESINYKSVISICAPIIRFNNNKIVSQNEWCVNKIIRLAPNEISYLAMAEGFGGVLYPAKCFDKMPSINEIKECLKHDDLFLKVFELKNKIPCTQISKSGNDVKRIQQKIDNENTLSLCKNLGFTYREEMTQKYGSLIWKYYNEIK